MRMCFSLSVRNSYIYWDVLVPATPLASKKYCSFMIDRRLDVIIIAWTMKHAFTNAVPTLNCCGTSTVPAASTTLIDTVPYPRLATTATLVQKSAANIYTNIRCGAFAVFNILCCCL